MLRSGILVCALLLMAAAAPAAMTPLAADGQGEYRFGACHARLKDGLLTVGNGLVERQWRVQADGALEATSLRDLKSGREWVGKSGAKADEKAQGELTAASGQASVTEEPSLLATLRVKRGAWTVETRLQVFAAARGVLMEREVRGPQGGDLENDTEWLNQLERFSPKSSAWTLTRVKFLDQTDRQAGPLAVETHGTATDPEFRTKDAGAEQEAGLRGNVFFIQEQGGDGLLFLKHAPLPEMRPMDRAHPKFKTPDLTWSKDAGDGAQWISLRADEITSSGGRTYRWVTLAYQGGRPGRIAALQEYYRNLRQYEPGRDGVLLTNTWGDRSKDGRVSEAFMKKEIDAAERLGVDAIMIDDGWQKGTTMNSVKKGGVWNGFYAAAQDFWSAHPERFPNGIKPLAELAKSKGIQFGLWFAPDSSGDFQNWEKDRDLVLGMHRERGVNYFKFDGIKMHSRAGEANVHKLVESVVEGSQGRISIDLDVTAEVRPGYFGIPNHGPIFVENRYSDTAGPDPEKRANSYWPHKTLRNFWLLAQYVDPVRLRMEFLNNSRNVAKYGSNPLAPANYEPDYLFAAVMFGSPLGWFETQNLPPAYFEKVAPLVRVWKANRENIFRGTIIPMGKAPDGKSWTGFFSAAKDGKSGYALVFRELNDQGVWRMALPLLEKGEYAVEKLAGEGEAQVNAKDGKLEVKIPEARRYLFVKVTKK